MEKREDPLPIERYQAGDRIDGFANSARAPAHAFVGRRKRLVTVEVPQDVGSKIGLQIPNRPGTHPKAAVCRSSELFRTIVGRHKGDETAETGLSRCACGGTSGTEDPSATLEKKNAVGSLDILGIQRRRDRKRREEYRRYNAARDSHVSGFFAHYPLCRRSAVPASGLMRSEARA